MATKKVSCAPCQHSVGFLHRLEHVGVTRLWKVRRFRVYGRPLPQNVDERLADSSVHRESTHRRAKPRSRKTVESVEPSHMPRGCPSIVIPRVTTTAVRPPQGSSVASSNDETGIPRASACLAHEVTAGGTLARATMTSTWPRVCPDSIRNFGSIPPPMSSLEAGLLRGRLRGSDASSPTSNDSRSRHLDSTTTEAQLSVRAPPVVMSSPLLVLALGPGDLLGVLQVQSCQSARTTLRLRAAIPDR